MHFSYEIKGKLTEKQETGLKSMRRIAYAFYDEKNKKHQRTREELKEITGLAASTLSKHLIELVKQGVIKGTVRVRDNRLTDIFEYNDRVFVKLDGAKSEKIREGMRFFITDKEIFFQRGFFAKGKGKSQRFIPIEPRRKKSADS
jgi:DNA-binding transcriptional ArsR family regulator